MPQQFELHSFKRVDMERNISSELPPDPVTIAPPLDTTVATNLVNATEFFTPEALGNKRIRFVLIS